MSEKKNTKDTLLETYTYLRHIDAENKFMCLICSNYGNRKNYTGNYFEFKNRHLSTIKHKERQRKWEEDGSPALKEVMEEGIEPEPHEDLEQEETWKKSSNDAELRFDIGRFILANRLPFNIAENLSSFIRHLSESYEIGTLIKANVRRKEISKLARSISETLKSKLRLQLERSPFSIAVDESSDINGSKYLAITTTYLTSLNSIKTSLFSVLPITTSSTGQTIFKKIDDEIFGPNKGLCSNFVGIVTDRGPNMVGQDLGLVTRLKAKYPKIVVMEDLAHLSDSIFKTSWIHFGGNIKKLCKSISGHFAHSSQAHWHLREIQQKQNAELQREQRYLRKQS